MGARRAVVTLSATAGALVLLASFHTTAGSNGVALSAGSSGTAAETTATSATTATAETTATTATTEAPTTAPVGTPATAAAPPPPRTPPSTAAAPPSTPRPTPPKPTSTTVKAKTVDGPPIGTPYGDVQVRVVIRGGQLVDVRALVLPSDRAHSRRISAEAAPLLRDEALQAQSANIDLLSGATYTSEGYAESLQGALDAARA